MMADFQNVYMVYVQVLRHQLPWKQQEGTRFNRDIGAVASTEKSATNNAILIITSSGKRIVLIVSDSIANPTSAYVDRIPLHHSAFERAAVYSESA